ncbi:MAG: TetR/AcrR family transcriptional regulator [Campylobacterales bacterium]|nr:TetR/AcrR family transcriptional regulator [Campylobacterales bacterium]
MSVRAKMQAYKRDLILEEAGKLFVRDGYENMKIADLAKAVELSVGTIYTLFGSKENLYTNYVLSQIEYYGALLREEIAPIESPVERVHKLVALKYEAMTKNRNALRQSIINDPTFFMNNTDEEHPLMELFRFIADEVMVPLAEHFGSSKDPMELTFLLEGLTIGAIKYTTITGEALMERCDETVGYFLTLLERGKTCTK